MATFNVVENLYRDSAIFCAKPRLANHNLRIVGAYRLTLTKSQWLTNRG